MYQAPYILTTPTPTQIQQYRLQNPASFQRSDEDIASMIKNQSSVPEFSRTKIQPPYSTRPAYYNGPMPSKINSQGTHLYKQPSFGQQIKDMAIKQGTGYVVNEGAKAGLDAAGVDAADVGGYLAAAKGVYGAGKVLTGDAPDKDKARESRQQLENAAAGYSTAGLSTVAQMADAKLFGSKGEKFRDKYEKYGTLGRSVVADKITEKALGFTGSGKGKEQQKRDAVRKMLQKNKFLDEDFDMTLADDSKYDLGRDGGAKDEFGRGILELDFTDSKPGDFQGVAIGNVNPLAAIITGGDKKLTTDFATYFTKGTMSNAGEDPAVVRANAIKQYSNAGLDKDKAIAAIDDLLSQGKVTTDDATAYKNGISMLFGGGGSSKQTSQGDRGAASQSGQTRRPKPKRRPSSSGDTNIIPVQAPSSTTLGINSTKGYGDNFAQNLANIYSQNQG